ncbi:SdrD B-like domain-containing protein [Fibrella arboris]|uniref:SdrD B-like domain-containing protein n=1 Tax=Fibrella arboris TaxID=3242486 RepID=UPI0035230E74
MVTGYPITGNPVSATTSATGSFTISGLSGSVRLEFTNLPSGDFDSFRGSSSGTSVQFVTAGATNANFGINYPANYCQTTNPQLITTCFVAINATNSPPLGSRDALVGVPYEVVETTKTVSHYAVVNDIGAAWGLAYKKDTKQLFSAAFTKRHVGFAAGGPNAIYVTNLASATPTTTQFFNFTTVGGTAVTSTTEAHGNDIPTALNSSNRLDSYDLPAFNAVGKTSLGDIDISDDDKTLYVVNLKNRTLYLIDIATKTPTAFAIPNPCGGQSYRPFAVKYYRGKAYLGVVCTREDLDLDANNDGKPDTYTSTAGLSATVYEFNGSSFNSVLSFPLTYKKQPTNADQTGQARAEYWRPWSTAYQSDRTDTSYPEAWLTDIEFDVDGDMILGLRDRFGDQMGYQNHRPIAGDAVLVSVISPGEVLRAGKCNPTDTQWTLESNGSICGSTASSNQTASEGPGSGKYYWGDRVQNGANHGMSSQAGLALLAGSGKLAMTAVDPLDDFNTGGIKRLINLTGAKDGNTTGTSTNPGAGAMLYGGSALEYGKANGLGDLEVLCNQAPIQIGNRVWIDTDNDGVQDPGEPALAGVVVTLKGPGLPTAGVNVTTNANGEYYFSNATAANATGFVYSLTGLTAGASYSLSFPTSASAGTYLLSSKPNAATGTNSDAIDTDPTSAGSISFTLGAAGENNFTYDAAYFQPAALGDYAFIDANKDGIQNAGDTPLPGVTVTLYQNGSAVATTTTNASGLYSFTGLAPGTANSYVVGFTTPTGYTATITNVGSDTADSDVSPSTGKTQSVTLAPGENNPTLDAGFYLLPASLGDYVFVDANKDGIQNTGDTPIAGVRVSLYRNGSAVASTTTDANGLYSFTGLTPGTANSYVVGFTAPAGYTATISNVGSDTADSDADPLTGRTQSVTLAPGEHNPTLDAGFYLIPASLGDYAFIDANKDGIQNAGDTPLPGVTVTLYQNGSAVATTTTNASGLYSFTGLTPGTSNSYVVGFTAPVGYTATISNVGSDTADSDASPITGLTQSVTLAPGEYNPTLDAGFYLKPASLGDYVFIDANKDGIQNAGDSPLAGVNVTLFQNGSAVATTTTNASGLYSFTGLAPGTANSYVVGFTAPAGYTATISNVGSDTADSDADPITGKTQSVTLAPGEHNPTLDAGFYLPTASLGNFVFEDVNKDGLQDAGDLPIQGAVVTLLQSGTVAGTTTTDVNGLYSFTGLTPGLPYSVSFTTPAGFSAATASNVGSNDAIDSDPVGGVTAPVTLTINENNTTLDAGFVRPIIPASLGDYAFIDANKDGIQNAGDSPLPGVTVTLYQNGSAVATTTTNAAGLYSFTGLAPGTANSYVVGFTAPAGYTATISNVGSDTADSDADPITGKTQSVTLAPGENNPTLDAGFYLPTASLGDYTFIDANKDGIQNAGDSPLAGVTVTLFLNGSAVATTTTNAAGFYSFTGLAPGTSNNYVVGFTAPANFSATISNVGSDTADSDANAVTGLTQSVTLAPGEYNPTLDAGFYPLTASLGDYVFEDSNANGQQDAGDVPIAGVAVTLISSGTVVATATTNAAGFYSFTGLTPGVPYSVSFSAPAGYFATSANSGNDASDSDGNPATGLTGVYTLTANETNPTVDMGYYRPASLGDYVFEDANRNGIQDAGDNPIPGVTVTLISNGTVVATTNTNANGLYSFTGLTPGVPYSVSFTTPAGYSVTTSNTGSNDAVDSDPVGGITAPVTLTSGEHNPTLDAGFFRPSASLGNFVFEDVNKDGLQDAGDLPIQGAVVTLLQSGTVAGTTTTDVNGLYSFTGLTPGLPYSVSFTTPAGFSAATASNVGSNDAIDSDPVGGVTAPVTLTASENNPTLDAGFVRAAATYAIAKTVNKSRVAKGQLVTYTISLTNTSATTATNVIVTDTFSSSGLTIVGSGSASTGSFAPSATGGTWTIPTLTGGAVATLSFQAQVNTEGLVYNVATAPGGTSTTATACLTVPFHVCENTPFEFLLTTPTGSSAYQWSLNGTPIPGATSATLSVTAIGEYTVATTNSAGCPDGSCCPFVIVADPAPSLTATALAASCTGSTPANNAQLTLMGSSTNAVSYNVSLGSSFTASPPLFATDQPLAGLTPGSVLLANQPNPLSAPGTTYTIRVYSAEGCFSDVVVVIPPAQCQCPPAICVPVKVRRIVSR